MKKILNWLVASSYDPKRSGLAFRGVLLGIATIVLQWAPAACALVAAACFDTTFIPQFVEDVADIAVVFLQIVALVVVGIGLLRKITLGRWAHPAAEI